jgi:hypothetical protein
MTNFDLLVATGEQTFRNPENGVVFTVRRFQREGLPWYAILQDGKVVEGRDGFGLTSYTARSWIDSLELTEGR